MNGSAASVLAGS